MPTLITPVFKDDLAINIDALLKDFTDEDFFEMCRQNPDMRMEMSKEGDIVIMPPVGGEISGQYISWIKLKRWNKLSRDEREGFPHICPDFVVELRLTSDPIERLKVKMEEYIENGARLGWLIDPIQKIVYIYRPSSEVEELDNPALISGDPLLKGFVLDLKNYFG